MFSKLQLLQEREIMRFNLNEKSDSKDLNPEPAAHDSSALTATLRMTVAKFQENLILL